MTFPDGFNVETFAASPGWRLNTIEQGIGEQDHVTSVTWTGREQSETVDPVFRFTGTLDAEKSYGVKVRQFYSDGSVTDWAGPEDSEEPAAFVRGVSSFGRSGNTALTIVALVLGALGVSVGAVALLAKSGSRPLT